MSGNKGQNLQLKYPCAWVYKIIGVDTDEMKSALTEIIPDHPYTVSHSRSSETSKYSCLNVELVVENESHRKALYETLKAHRAIKIIL